MDSNPIEFVKFYLAFLQVDCMPPTNDAADGPMKKVFPPSDVQATRAHSYGPLGVENKPAQPPMGPPMKAPLYLSEASGTPIPSATAFIRLCDCPVAFVQSSFLYDS